MHAPNHFLNVVFAIMPMVTACGGGFYMVDAADDAVLVDDSVAPRLNTVPNMAAAPLQASARSLHIGAPSEATESDDADEIPDYESEGAYMNAPPVNRQRDYDKWFAALEKPEQREVRSRCAKEPADLLDICKGIGPLAIPAPPEQAVLRAAWHKALTSAQRRYVASKCANPSFVVSELCGGRPTLPEKSGFAGWYSGLQKAEKAWVDRRCAAADPVMYSEYCGGIGPLRIPIQPDCVMLHMNFPGSQQDDQEREALQKACNAWDSAITAQQQKYIDRHCFGEDSDLCGTSTPLVVKFNDAPVAYSPSPAACDRSLSDPNCNAFQFSPGHALRTDWPTATTPWIALDRNHNGTIDDGSELFGSNTVLPTGAIAKDGYQAIAPLDTNNDGKIDREDPPMSALLLWADRNHNRHSEADELSPLIDTITSIPLQVATHKRCDKRGNCEVGRVAIQYRHGDRTYNGSIVDVVLRIRLSN
jgi:hypothetical protein